MRRHIRLNLRLVPRAIQTRHHHIHQMLGAVLKLVAVGVGQHRIPFVVQSLIRRAGDHSKQLFLQPLVRDNHARIQLLCAREKIRRAVLDQRTA